MLTELQIENFRSIRSLRLDGLGRINILGGRNGSGKSTVLEAVELLLTPKPLRAAFQNDRRGLEVLPSQNTAQASAVEEPWYPLFNDFIPGKGVGLAGKWNGRDVTATFETAFTVEQINHLNLLARNPAYVFSVQQWINEGRILRIRAAQSAGGVQQESLVHPVPDGTWGWTAEISDLAPCIAVWATDNASQIQQKDLADLFSVAVQDRQEEFVLEVMKEIVPGLKKLVSLSRNKKAKLYADTGARKLIPVSLLGDGAVRVLRILLAGLAEDGGVWLVDEIENGVHYRFLPALWRGLGQACKLKDRQLICTTHSFEEVRVARETLSDSGELLPRYFRVDRGLEGHKAVSYQNEVLETAMQEEIEIRD